MKKIIFVVIWSVVFLVGLGAVWDLGTLLVIIVMQHVHPLGVDAVKLIGMSWFVVPILMGLLGSILGIAGKLPGTKRIADAPARDAEQPSLARPSGKAGFILALASLVMGPLFAVPAIILGRRVLSKLNKIDGERNARRLAISSIMIGCIALCLHIPLIVIGYRAYHCFQIQQKYTAAVKCRAESLAQLKTSNIPS